MRKANIEVIKRRLMNKQMQCVQKTESRKETETVSLHKNKSICDLVNGIVCYNACKSQTLVNNSVKLFYLSQKVLGKSVTNYLVSQSFAKVFTAGETQESMTKTFKQINDQKFNVITFYSVEASENHSFTRQEMDQIAQEYTNLVYIQTDYLKKYQNQISQKNAIMAVKMTGLVNGEVLLNMNKKQAWLQSMFDIIDENSSGFVQLSQLIDYLKNQCQIDASESEFKEFVELVFKKIDGQQISRLEWQIFMHCFYIDGQINENKVVKKMMNYDEQTQQLLKEFMQRVYQIFDAAVEQKVQLLVDAEQTYYQVSIDFIVQQLQRKYNNSKSNTVFNTFQNYLKQTKQRINYEIEKNKYLGLPTAVKLVRGAYIIEETELSVQNGTENPICDGYQATTDNYHGNLENIMQQSIKNSEILIASHNKDTCKFAIELGKKYGKEEQLQFAQLYGLTDDLSMELAVKNQKVYKYVPYGPIDVMIPYLSRRAIESHQMIQNVDQQIESIKGELKSRLKLL